MPFIAVILKSLVTVAALRAGHREPARLSNATESTLQSHVESEQEVCLPISTEPGRCGEEFGRCPPGRNAYCSIHSWCGPKMTHRNQKTDKFDYWSAACLMETGSKPSHALLARDGTEDSQRPEALVLTSLRAQHRRQVRHNVSHSENASQSQNGSQMPSPFVYQDRPPRVYFLFLAVDQVANLEVWMHFFSMAPQDQYRAFVHCKTPQCREQVRGTPLVPVQDVPTTYCFDLVSAMNQLIAQALLLDPGPGSKLDQFTFVSDSTLPAKPFSHIYSSLTSRIGSSFCLFPTSEWADAPSQTGYEMAPKYSQWITLNREHAEKTRLLWVSGRWRHFMEHFSMNAQSYAWNNNSFSDSRNFGCLDEFWYFLAIFDSIKDVYPDSERFLDLIGFENSPIRVNSDQRWQGRCDTFVLWHKHVNAPGPSQGSPFSTFYVALDQQSTPNSGDAARPGWWTQMSTHGLYTVRNSDFLFLRKVYDKPSLVSIHGNVEVDFAAAYSNIVLMS